MSFEALLAVVFVVMLSGYLHYLLACAAERRSRSFWMWLVFSLPFSPIAAYIALRLAGTSRKVQAESYDRPRRILDIGAPAKATGPGWTGDSWFERLMGADKNK